MRLTVATALLTLSALVAGGCASKAWNASAPQIVQNAPLPAPLAPHRAVERVLLRIRGRNIELVGYRSWRPEEVRTQLLLESGVSVLDVAVRGATDQQVSGGAFDAVPRFAETTVADLRRLWGDRSVFALQPHVMISGVSSTMGRLVDDGVRTLPALPARDGSWLALEATKRSLDVTLLSPQFVPEARIEYADFGDDQVPREVRLIDLLDGHTVDVEVEEVRPTPSAPSR
jgi:hypothetical protein